MHVYEKSGLARLLPSILEKVVYVGSSAGAMVMGQRISTPQYWEEFGEGNDFGTKNYVGLVDIAIKPHLDSPEFIDRNEAKMRRGCIGYTGISVCPRDNQAIMIDADTTTYIGGPPLIINPHAR
jgi:dipeptidase E